MEQSRQCPCLKVLLFALLCIALPVLGVRQDADEPLPHLEMVARGKDMAEFAANVEKNARLHADRLGSVESFTELVHGSNSTEARGGYTPPCPWQKHLNNDGKVVGAGSFGEVFTATVKCDSSFTVAIKKMKGLDASYVLKEAKLMEIFSSSNFVKVYGMGKSSTGSSVRYILMEAAKGGAFEGYVKNAGRSQDAFKHAMNLFIDALEGLVEMHWEGYHHRDIKPANILVTAQCSTGKCHAKMADLGESCEKSKCTGAHGTPYYVAPEILKTEFNVRRNDVWSMGIVLYRILNGGNLPYAFLNAPGGVSGLYKVIKTFEVTAQREYQKMPESPLKKLLAAMLTNDVSNRIGSDEALDWALRAVKNCGSIAENGDRCPADPSKVEQLLPACWGGSGKGEWSPKFPIKKPDPPKVVPQQQVQEVKPPITVKQKVYEVVERPLMVKEELPEVIEEKDPNNVGVRLHERQFAQGTLDADVIPETGAVEKVQPGAFQQAQVQEGWFIHKVCGFLYSWQRLKDAAAGKCNKYPYTIVFRESIVAEVELPDDAEGMKMVTKQQQEGTIKTFNIKFPKSHVGLSYIFKNNFGRDAFGNAVTVYVSEQGVVQPAWARLSKKYTKQAGIPLEPGDEILSVNDEKWDDFVNDEQFKLDAMSGKLGKLTFLILKA